MNSSIAKPLILFVLVAAVTIQSCQQHTNKVDTETEKAHVSEQPVAKKNYLKVCKYLLQGPL